MIVEIKNKHQLLAAGVPESRQIVLEITEEVLGKLNAYGRIRSIMRIEGTFLKIGDKSWDLSKKDHIYLIGAGKACNAMAKAVEDILGDFLTDGIAVVKIQEPEDGFKRTRVYTGGHPIPNEEGYRACMEIRKMIDQASAGDLFICVMSGGSSALMSCPVDGITLQEEMEATDVLLKSGAGIREINAVRRHISGMNGGRMAELIRDRGAELIGFNISDSVGNPPTGDISVPWTGFYGTPMGPDQTTLKDALGMIRDYNLKKRLPKSVVAYLETPGEGKETPKEFPENTYYQINTLPDSCVYAMEAAKKRKIPAIVLTTFIEEEAREAGAMMASVARQIQEYGQPVPPPCLVFSAGEAVTTITDNSRVRGHGGPSQEMALGFALKASAVGGACFLSIDSEGTDGSTDAAGGIADSESLEALAGEGVDIYRTFREHSGFEALTKAGGIVYTGNTGTNVCDFNVLYVPKR